MEMITSLWPFIWHIGTSTGLLMLCAAGFYFFPNLRSTFICLAVGIIVSMVSYIVGVKNERSRCEAMQARLQSEVTTVVEAVPAKVKLHRSILHPFSRVQHYDRWDTNQ